MQERLQKIISASGLMSRRAAEECIKVGRVSVNGVAAARTRRRTIYWWTADRCPPQGKSCT